MLEGAEGNRPSPGLRVNPELSTVEVALYDPVLQDVGWGPETSSWKGLI